MPPPPQVVVTLKHEWPVLAAAFNPVDDTLLAVSQALILARTASAEQGRASGRARGLPSLARVLCPVSCLMHPLPLCPCAPQALVCIRLTPIPALCPCAPQALVCIRLTPIPAFCPCAPQALGAGAAHIYKLDGETGGCRTIPAATAVSGAVQGGRGRRDSQGGFRV